MMVMLHTLWSKAVGTPGYNKDEWLTFERDLLGMEAEIAELRGEVARLNMPREAEPVVTAVYSGGKKRMVYLADNPDGGPDGKA